MELYDLDYGKSFVLRLMAGALYCSLWLKPCDTAYDWCFMLHIMDGACVAAYGWSFMI